MEEKYVLRGAKPSLPIYPENTGKFIRQKLVSRNEDEVLLINDETGEKITCNELLTNSLQLTQAFSNYNMLHDNVIALCSDNHINYITVVLGALQAAVPIVFINPGYTEHEIQHALNVTKPEMIFCSTLYVNKFIKLKSKNPFIRKIVTIDSDTNTVESDNINKFINQYCKTTGVDFGIRRVDINNHIAFILFSSGTTGLPKGVTLTHLNLNATLAAVLGPEMETEYESNITIGVLPFFHIFGLFGALITLCRVTVPPLVQFLLKSPIVNKYDLSSVREIICGAAPLGKDMAEAIKKKFDLKLVRNGYGMTESGLAISFPPLDVEAPSGSVGGLFPGISCVIRHPTTGEHLGPHQNGEICIRGLSVTKGYYRNEEATKTAFTKDGWLRTGDVGYHDENGYLYVVDRIKELIKYKGFQVAPAELEQILVTHPEIQDAGVIGIPDENAGEVPLAFVVKQPGAQINEEEIHKYIAKFVSHNKYLHGGIIFIDAIPRNPSGKIIRRKLKEVIAKKKSRL
ncbi:hypothetical protein Trydic_g15481 [Trypoxylus dichotomus]